MLTEGLLLVVVLGVLLLSTYLGKRLSFIPKLIIGIVFLLLLWLQPFSWAFLVITAVVLYSLWTQYKQRRETSVEDIRTT